MTVALSPRPQLVQLNPCAIENPNQVERQEGRKAALYSLASKVCLVAFLSIAAGAIALSLGLALPVPPALLFALLFSTIPLQLGFQSYMIRSIECRNRANEAKEKGQELARIQGWGRTEIAAFFNEHKISLDKLPLELLRRVDRKEPLRALLPGIASYQFLRNRAQRLYLDHLKNLYNDHPDPFLLNLGRREGWKILEFQALPAAFQAAHMLQILADPTSSKKLDDLGAFRAKEFDERRFDQLLEGKDDYFVFKEEGRPPLTFSEAQALIATIDIDALRLKLHSRV